jgi:uncharacterized protein YndB with AHSA1/START domain
MPTIQEEIVIAVPSERVFDRLAEPERAPEWTPNLLRVQRISEQATGPGLRTALVATVGGRQSRGTGRCLAWDPPRRLVLETVLEVGVTSVTTFDLSAEGSTTRLAARVDYSLPPKGLGRLVGGLLGDTLARRDLRAALANLKQQLEAEQRARPQS